MSRVSDMNIERTIMVLCYDIFQLWFWVVLSDTQTKTKTNNVIFRVEKIHSNFQNHVSAVVALHKIDALKVHQLFSWSGDKRNKTKKKLFVEGDVGPFVYFITSGWDFEVFPRIKKSNKLESI